MCFFCRYHVAVSNDIMLLLRHSNMISLLTAAVRQPKNSSMISAGKSREHPVQQLENIPSSFSDAQTLHIPLIHQEPFLILPRMHVPPALRSPRGASLLLFYNQRHPFVPRCNFRLFRARCEEQDARCRSRRGFKQGSGGKGGESKERKRRKEQREEEEDGCGGAGRGHVVCVDDVGWGRGWKSSRGTVSFARKRAWRLVYVSHPLLTASYGMYQWQSPCH